MLDTLRRIVQEVNAAPDLARALDIMVRHIKLAMQTDVCSVYLVAAGGDEHVLMATDGLNPESVGKVRLPLTAGLIGLVHERAEPVNLDDAPRHPRYVFVAETGEVRYHAFLGVPIIQHRKVLGVLVVRQQAQRRFRGDEVSFLFTLAAQLAGAIAHAEASGGIAALQSATPATCFLHGQPGSAGVGIGRARVVYLASDLDAVPDRACADPVAEEARFRTAVETVQHELRQLGANLPADDRAMFDAFVLMLGSDRLVEGCVARIRAGHWAPGALRMTISEHAQAFGALDDAYMRERASDIRDIGRRLLLRLTVDEGAVRNWPIQTVLVGEEISAAQVAEVPRERLVGVVSARGSGFSHAAILARALGVPAVMGLGELPLAQLDGKEVVVDGYTGRICIQPIGSVRDEFERLAREEADLSEGLLALRDLPSATPDGVRMPLLVNTGLLSDITPTLQSGAEGIGLYRTEFPFLVRDRFPDEDEQYRIYHQVLAEFAPRPVTLRTLDIGGDKALPYFPIREDNPFLGWRGIRITLDHPEIFLTQLRAMLRADQGLGNLRLLLPMISQVSELDEALQLLARASNELIDELGACTLPPIGVMIEVPSAVYQTAALARRVDFLSVGSNDLTQYLLAVDRNNARVAKLYDSLHPAVLQALVQIVDGAHASGKPVAVCGEMAGDPAAALLLLGMGMDSLSMSVAGLPRIKWVMRSFTQARARELLTEALACESPEAVRALLNAALDQAGLGGLVRPGR